ncbi:MAG TPA: methyltransferase domain-containing protein [Leptolinea sp.]
MIKSWLAHPLTRGLDLDDPHTTTLRRQVIAQNKFLLQIYHEWYQYLKSSPINSQGGILELGSGGGFLSEFIPELISSEVFYCPGTDITLDGQVLPFASQSLQAIFMINVLHHIPNNRLFFSEAARCIKKGGYISMIEPWKTPWSSFVYNVLHHEPFEPDAMDWHLPTKGPLTTANDALPWIMFDRDRVLFESEFPEWKIKKIQLMMPFRYLVSGGVSLRQLMPLWSYPLWKSLEKVLAPLNHLLSMFAFIQLERQ